MYVTVFICQQDNSKT